MLLSLLNWCVRHHISIKHLTQKFPNCDAQLQRPCTHTQVFSITLPGYTAIEVESVTKL